MGGARRLDLRVCYQSGRPGAGQWRLERNSETLGRARSRGEAPARDSLMLVTVRAGNVQAQSPRGLPRGDRFGVCLEASAPRVFDVSRGVARVGGGCGDIVSLRAAIRPRHEAISAVASR